MSMTQVAPRMEFKRPLPTRTSTSPSMNLPNLPTPSPRARAANLVMSPTAGPSRSVPTSPTSRGIGMTAGITKIDLGPSYRPHPSQPFAPRSFSSSTIKPRSKSRPRPSSSSEDTDSTEVDSDSTFVPGRVKQRTHSQPDLTALRSRLGGWVDGVTRTQAEEKKRAQSRKTPPSRNQPLAARSPHSKSQPSLVALRLSPRQAPLGFTLLTTDSSPNDSPSTLRHRGVNASDADDDYDGTDSPSSGSLTFSPKRTRRRRSLVDKGLGLSLEPEMSPQESSTPLLPSTIDKILRRSSLLSLRLLAVVPSIWGMFVLLDAFVNGGFWREVWPWGVDFSRDALERLVNQSGGYEGTWRDVLRGDMVLATAWAICTGHFCFCLTTGLTHRWRNYYSLPSTVTRLISLQCLCWPMTYLTLWVLGADRVLLAWVVIGVTTGWSRTVQIWVTSNVIPESRDGDVTPGSRMARRSPAVSPREMNGTLWEKFTWDRRWDWDVVAREVGWKVGGLLLVTTAWLFWCIEVG